MTSRTAAAKALAIAIPPIQPIPSSARMCPSLRSKIGAAAVIVFFAPEARAQLRLRGDALADTQAPAGIVVLHGEDKVRRWLDAETVAWVGSSAGPSTGGDVLTLSVRARHPETGSEARVGRMVTTMGAVRPVHMDGVRGLARIGGYTTVEGFAGVPVVPSFGWKDFDWTAGGRIAETVGSVATVGGSYALRKRIGSVDDEEMGVDFALTPTKWLTAAGRSSFDVVSRGIGDALVSVSAQNEDLRGEVFVTHRDPSRLIPKTSLFSVLGDVPATSTGGTARWRAAPRLELVATGSVQTHRGVDGKNDTGGQGLARANLALDDQREGALGLEARRVDFAGSRWIGARATASVPLRWALRFATELELVRPDDPGSRSALWPWALVALSWRGARAWDVAGAVEAAGGPDRSWVAALARFSYAFEVTR